MQRIKDEGMIKYSVTIASYKDGNCNTAWPFLFCVTYKD